MTLFSLPQRITYVLQSACSDTLQTSRVGPMLDQIILLKYYHCKSVCWLSKQSVGRIRIRKVFI